MCTAATYKTKAFYFGRTLDYEFSYGDEVVITPRNYPFSFCNMDKIKSHYAMIGMAYVADNYPLYYDAVWRASILWEMQTINKMYRGRTMWRSLNSYRGF